MKGNKKFRNLGADENANVGMIILGLLILIISALAVAIFFPIMGSIDYTTIDASFDGTPSQNASEAVMSTAGTVFGLNPLAALVAVAAGIIAMLLGAFALGGRVTGI